MVLDAETCYRAIAARDRRFDGVFFVGVRTTGVYCRPVCPARTPRRDRCVFFAHGAEAEREGFRACFRCRPELAPGNAPIDAVPRLVASALARVEDGFLNEGSVRELAAALGVTPRHLHRALTATLGVSPVELAQSRRMALAKQLLQDTALPMTEIAFAAGFASVRRFNALFAARFGRAPTALRRAQADSARTTAVRAASAHATTVVTTSTAGTASTPALQDGVALRLDYRPPFDWDALLAFLAPRALPGVEAVAAGAYLRTVDLGGHTGWLRVSHDPRHTCLRAEVASSLAPVLMTVVARLRSLFDLDAHPAAIDAQLAGDGRLRPLVRARPGVRIPGAFDGFETALRAVLGQQITVRGATTLSGRLAATFGKPVTTPFPELCRTTPRPADLAEAGAHAIAVSARLPRARADALSALAREVARGALPLVRHAAPEDAVARLTALPGIGDWTAQYVAMRALGWPDAFPASDLALRQILGVSTVQEALMRAEPWRPWRAYAAMRLWLQGKREVAQ